MCGEFWVKRLVWSGGFGKVDVGGLGCRCLVAFVIFVFPLISIIQIMQMSLLALYPSILDKFQNPELPRYHDVGTKHASAALTGSNRSFPSTALILSSSADHLSYPAWSENLTSCGSSSVKSKVIGIGIGRVDSGCFFGELVPRI